MDPTDASTLERLVGPTTYARGRSYARQNVVLTSHWTRDRTRLVGAVQGGDVAPYSVAVTVILTPTGRLADVDGACTCPVGYNCKHAVALLLADDQGPSGTTATAPSLSLVSGGEATSLLETSSLGSVTPLDPAAPGRTSRAPDWEAPLRALVAPDPDDPSEAGVVDLGLQFELVLTPPDRGSRSSAPTTGIRLRPVLRHSSRSWVRTGISWSRLDQYHAYVHQMRGDRVPHLMVLTELLALSRLSNRRSYFSYSSADEGVWLQTVNSRRLWDLLAEARDLQLPMIQSGRQASPVELRPTPARSSSTPPAPAPASSSVPGHGRRRGRAAPAVVADRGARPTGSPGGTALRRDPPSGPGQLEAPVDDHLRGLLAFGAIAVPPEDEERFLRDLYPSLRRRIVVGPATTRSTFRSCRRPGWCSWSATPRVPVSS